MIVLCTGFVILLMSFYRRFKRMQARAIPTETNIDIDDQDKAN